MIIQWHAGKFAAPEARPAVALGYLCNICDRNAEEGKGASLQFGFPAKVARYFILSWEQGLIMRASTFKVIATAVFAVVTAIPTASAADLAARPYTKAPPALVEVYNWTGFYIGGNVGYSWGRSRDTSTLTNTAGTVLFTSIDRSDLNGFVGGGQIGHNWQVQNWVWGLEADIQGTDEHGSRAFTCPTAICTPSAIILV